MLIRVPLPLKWLKCIRQAIGMDISAAKNVALQEIPKVLAATAITSGSPVKISFRAVTKASASSDMASYMS